MNLRKSVLVAIAIVVPSLCAYSERYVEKHRVSDRILAVVAEAELEPRSIGSYTVRIYEILNPEFPTDNFVCGILGKRNGTVEQVLVQNLDEQAGPEIIVTIRNVGTGSFLSVHAYRYRDGRLEKVAEHNDLPKDTNPLEVLK